ncbi:MAG: hypothetical protein OCC45_00660 [Desulfotalea sp.]
MKKVLFLLVMSLSCVFILSSFASAESNREYILNKKKAYEDVVVVDLASCQERAKREHSYAFAVAQSNQSSSSYYNTIQQYKEQAYDECRRKW